MGRRNRRSLVEDLLEHEDLKVLSEMLKKEKKTEEKKPPKLHPMQVFFILMLTWPFMGAIVAGLWKLSWIATKAMLQF